MMRFFVGFFCFYFLVSCGPTQDSDTAELTRPMATKTSTSAVPAGLILRVSADVEATTSFGVTGTLLELLDGDTPIIGLGFPEIYNSYRRVADNSPQVFVRDSGVELKITDLGKPANWYTSSFFQGGGLLVRNLAKGGPNAINGAIDGEPWALKSRTVEAAERFKQAGLNPLPVDILSCDFWLGRLGTA
jgi:hypothetical protein